MNKIVKTAVLTFTALATIASTIQLADAGERYWRRHHVVKPWNKRLVIAGTTAGIVAGAIVATRPRVVYRADPVIVDQEPTYESESGYDSETVYTDPEPGDGVGIYRDETPEADDYATPRYDDGDDQQAYDDDQGAEDDYFPGPPAIQGEEDGAAIHKLATIEAAPRKQVKKADTASQADAIDLKPWSKEWKDWCAGRFSSFNPQNGTYLGYDQKRHFCKTG